MDFLLGITPFPVLSALLWIVLVVTALYFARPSAHNAIRAVARALHRTMRVASKAVSRAEINMAARNREVLLAAGREAKERIVEREFDRVNETVRKDLANFSTLRLTADPAKELHSPPSASQIASPGTLILWTKWPP